MLALVSSFMMRQFTLILILNSLIAITYKDIILVVGYQQERYHQRYDQEVVVVDNCDLDCPDGIECVKGSVIDHPNTLFDSNVTTTSTEVWNGIHCACPYGKTGLLCEVSYETCVTDDEVTNNNTDSTDNQQQKCYNGGKCMAGQMTDTYGNDQRYCDCREAIDSIQNIQYVGKYCQHAVALLMATDLNGNSSGSNYTNGTVKLDVEQSKTNSTSGIALKCQDDPSQFCLNGGKCNNDYPAYGLPCLCVSGYNGPRCEYVDGTVPNCTLQCMNDGECVLGKMADQKFDLFWKNAILDGKATSDELDMMYCDCPETHDGPLCEIDRVPCGTTTVSTTSGSETKQSFCYYGSQCKSRLDPNNSTNILYNCDCNAANTDEIAYIGLYCQYEVDTYCTTTDTNERYYCVNEGTCSSDGLSTQCTCPDEYKGLSCQYLKSDVVPGEDNGDSAVPDDDQEDNDDVITEGNGFANENKNSSTDCNIACVHGVCRSGYKNVSSDLNEIISHTQHLFFDSSDKQFNHCVCDDDSKWTGLLCEIPVDTCDGANRHFCLHGGKCVENGNEQLCDCENENDAVGTSMASFYAGQHCEHPIHDICTTDPNPIQGQPLSFCVNGGVCKSKVAPGQIHPGCYCEHDFVGPHCEIRESVQVSNADLIGRTSSWTAEDAKKRIRDYNTDNDNSKTSGQITLIVLGSFALIGIATYLSIVYVRQRKRRYNDSITNTISWANKEKKDSKNDDVIVYYDTNNENHNNNIAPARFEDDDHSTVLSNAGIDKHTSSRSIFETAMKTTHAAVMSLSSAAPSSRDPMATHLAPSTIFGKRTSRRHLQKQQQQHQQRHSVLSSKSNTKQSSNSDDDDDNNDNDHHDETLETIDPYHTEFQIEEDASSTNHSRDGILFIKNKNQPNGSTLSSSSSVGSSSNHQQQQRPQVYIGPPRDEDGHVLHSVDII